MSDTSTTTTAVSIGFSITPESVQQLLEFLERGQNVAVSELANVQPLELPAQPSPEDVASLTVQKEVYVQILAKCKMVYDKMTAKRKAFTDPIKDKIGMIMAFENRLDPTKDNNDYAKARKVIENFNQQVLQYTKQQEAKAEREKKRTQYKVDLRTAVEKRLLEMMTGKEKNLTDGMIKWEAGLALENIAEREASLRKAPLDLKQESYDACFNTDFPLSNLFTPEEIRYFIQGLKKELTYAKYNEDHQKMAAVIKNMYLAKLPDIKANLEKIKGDAEAEKKRKDELAEQSKTQLASIDAVAVTKREEIDHRQEMGHMDAEFQEQGTTADLPGQNTRKIASFESDSLWLKPFLEVVAHVAISKAKSIRNPKGEYIASIAWWLKEFESCHQGKVIAGLKMTDEAKTVIKAKG